MSLTRIVNDYKDSVVAASTGANINLSAAPSTLDGVSLAANYRVLVKDQNPSALNGIYRITTLGTGSNGVWTRSSDFNDWREITAGAMVFVQMGAINGNSFYYINGAEGNVTINSTAINFSNLYSLNNNATSFTGNVNIGGNLNVVGNIITNSYETVTLTEYANTLSVTGNISLSNNGNINVAAGGNIYLGNTPVGRFYSANIAPSAPNLGDRWYQGNADILFEYVQDAANNKFWLDLSSNPSSYGNLTVANTLTVNGNLSAAVSSINITGGSSGYVLQTNGSGGLSWVAVTATTGGSNTTVQFNDAGSLGGATYIQYNKTSGNLVSNSTTASTSTTTGALVISGGIGVGGNIFANNFYYSNGTPIISFIYDLDDISYYTDSFKNTFSLTYNQATQTVLSPWQLTVTVNGQLQPAWSYNSDKVWQSLVNSGNKGYTVVNNFYPNGNVQSGPFIKFADPLPIGTQVLMRTVTGSYSAPTKVYPFKPVEIVLGAD
jgi:hypothetical protein